MNETENQACPLCDLRADFQVVDLGNRKQFRCLECGSFQITRSAEKRLKSCPGEWKTELSRKASGAAVGSILDISIPSPSSDQSSRNEIKSAFISTYGLGK